MEILDHIIPDHTLHALGWTVIHSLWQGLFIALLLGFYLYRQPLANARQRYMAGFSALGATLVAAVTTFFVLSENPASSLSFFAEGEGGGMMAFEAAPQLFFAEKLDEYMPLIVTAWLTGMAFFLLKMLSGLLYVQRLKHRHLTAVPTAWLAVLEKLKAELELKPVVKMAASALVKTPMVVGWLKPMVLMPIGAVNQLDLPQVEAILAHELAHIARYDYALNLLQSLIEVLFYFNPAVWWISANIRTERENCCDDLAVKLCGNPLDYARALVSLQEMHQATPAFALSFAGGKNQLLARIKRILKQPHKNSNAMEKFSVIGLVLAALVMLSMKAATNLDFLPAGQEEFEHFDYSDAMFMVDTLPMGNVHIHKNSDAEQFELRLKNGEIKYLEIDGEEIPKEEYGDYEERVVEMLEDVPPPPPAPPAPPHINAPVPPPAPPAPSPVEPGMAPPAPPAPSAPFSRTITTERDGKKTIITVEGQGGEPMHIEVESGKKGEVIINGKVIEGLEDGEERILLEEGFPSNIFHFDGGEGQPLFFHSEGEGNLWHYSTDEEEGSFHFSTGDFDGLDFETEEGEHIFLFGEEGEFDVEAFELEHMNEEVAEMLRLQHEALEDLHEINLEELEGKQQEIQEEMERMREEQIIIVKEIQEKQVEEMKRRREIQRSKKAM